MQRTHHELFRSIFSVLLAATIFFAFGCNNNTSGSSALLVGERVFGFIGGPETYGGGPQPFIVPAGVNSITVSASGGRGGNGWNANGGGIVGGMGGFGGNVEATLTVTPGETLCIYVGGAGIDGTASDTPPPTPGGGGWNGGGNGRVHGGGSTGGGGGGASDIRRELQLEGQADDGTATQMEDSTASFVTDGILPDMYLMRGTVYTGAEYERITSVDSETEITTSAFTTAWTNQFYKVIRKCQDPVEPPGLDDRILVAGGGGSGSGWCVSGGGSGGHGGGIGGGNGLMCDASQDLPPQCDTMPDLSLSVGGELGDRPPFSSEVNISPALLTTTATASCATEDQGGVPNARVTITNDTAQDFIEVYYVANSETTITNVDGLINGEEAFKIDNVGSNTPLAVESMDPDGIFQAGETWEFILQDYSNTLALDASELASIGIPSDLDNYSSGSLIGIVPGNGGTDTAGGWAGGALGVGGTQSDPEKFPKNPGPEFPFSLRASGAGGGGYYGGGAADASGGGGGSSFVTPVGSSGIIHQQGVRDGNGLVIIGTN